MLSMSEKDHETIYRDPMLLCAFFGHKDIGGSWGAGNTGTILADFSDYDDKDTIWCHYKLDDEDAVDDEDRTLKGGEIPKYVMKCEHGQLMKEVTTLKFVDFVDEIIGFSADANFDDGEGYAAWALDADDAYHATEIAVEWNGSGMTALGIDRQGFTLTLENEKLLKYTSSSLVPSHHWDGDENNSLEVKGIIDGIDILLTEVEKEVEDRIKATVIVRWDSTGGQTKYLQATNMFVESVDNRDIPKANVAVERTYTFKGGKDSKASLHGSYLSKTDPSARIST